MVTKKLSLKSILSFMLTFVCVITCGIALTGCGKMNRYTSVIPTDQDYKATLNYTWGVNDDSYKEDWKVIRKNVTFCGQERTLLYTYNNNQGYVLRLNGNQWEPYTGYSGDKWSDIYGSYSQSGSFVYEMTDSINGRYFPSSKKVETSEYLEYDFGRDNEVFKISNNPYHVLLYYNFKSSSSFNHKEATFTLGTPAEQIPYISTVTPEMIGE